VRDPVILGAVATAFCCACSGANPSSGQSAYLQVQGAQYVAGAIDSEPQNSLPEVHSISTANNQLFPGVAAKNISGTTGPGSNAVVIGLVGDTGHWVFPVQDQDQNRPGDFTFSCSASFSRNTPVGDGGAVSLVVRASDRNGHLGPAMIQPMIMDAILPTGALVVSLDWDTQADLDLHVQMPHDADAGVNEIWSRKPSGLSAGTAGATFSEATAAGYLDFDSNSQCVIDGRRVENVIFPGDLPSGDYTVRVDTFSLCGEATARWRVQVFADGWTEPQVVYGQSTETDTRYSHGQGAGAQALVVHKL
jgi:hypothetical protein